MKRFLHNLFFCSVVFASVNGALAARLLSAEAIPVGESNCNSNRSNTSEEYAKRLLFKCTEYYRQLNSFSGVVVADVVTKQQSGRKQHQKNRFQFQFKRPAYLTIATLGSSDRGNAVLIGEHGYFEKQDWGMSVENTGTWREIFDNRDFYFATNGATKNSLLEEIFAANPYSALTEGLTAISYDGVERVNGAPCHCLTLKKNDRSTKLWFDVGKKPWIRKYKPFSDQDTGTVKFGITVLYSKMKANPTVVVATSVPMHRSKKVEHFVVSPEQQSQHPLIGIAAPDFTVHTHKGKSFTLSKHRNKVIVLEFWATWCVPCCQAMPVIAAVTDDFARQGVEFIAINQGEHSGKIHQFLRTHPTHFVVGIDSDSKVSKLYHVGGIPQTVIIDKDGVVRFVHIGVGNDLQERLRAELHSILTRLRTDIPYR